MDVTDGPAAAAARREDRLKTLLLSADQAGAVLADLLEEAAKFNSDRRVEIEVANQRARATKGVAGTEAMRQELREVSQVERLVNAAEPERWLAVARLDLQRGLDALRRSVEHRSKF